MISLSLNFVIKYFDRSVRVERVIVELFVRNLATNNCTSRLHQVVQNQMKEASKKQQQDFENCRKEFVDIIFGF